MKRLMNVLVLALAVNFLALAGGVAWLFQSGHADRAKVAAIREVLFPKPLPSAPATQPTQESATTQPVDRLDELIARRAGKGLGEQAEVIQQNIDLQLAQLDRRRRELKDLQAQVASEQAAAASANQALEVERQRLAAQQQQRQAAQADQGFDDSLKLYSAMPGKQAKAVFMQLADDDVVRYLEAMPPRAAAKIIREFKSPSEIARIQRIMEGMRKGKDPTPTTQPARNGVRDNFGGASVPSSGNPGEG